MQKDKLPEVGTTIFTVMTSLAQQHNAINLSQGFPDFPCDKALKKAVQKRIEKDYNQYAPMAGVEILRKRIQKICQEHYGVHYDWEKEITITVGATEGLFCAIAAVVHPNDEVILFEPAYDSYAPVVKLFGGKIVPIALYPPDFQIPWETLKEKISSKTKLIILNTPHNPIAKVWTQEEIEQLWQLIKGRNIFVISDEVYEYIAFVPFFSVRQHSQLRERSFIVGSFGKSLHVTGWKVGYVLAPEPLTTLLRKIHQFTPFCVSTPLQYGIADYLTTHPDFYQKTLQLYERKRKLFLNLLKETRFEPLNCQGTYFMLLRYGHISTMDDVAFSQYLTKEVGVAVIPISVFYSGNYSDNIIRICFAKQDEVLIAAAKRLATL